MVYSRPVLCCYAREDEEVELRLEQVAALKRQREEAADMEKTPLLDWLLTEIEHRMRL